MGDTIITHELHDDQDHRNSSPSSTGDLFEFFRGGLSDYSEEKMMSHAEDIIFSGKLIPINQQPHRKNLPEESENPHRRNQQNYPRHRRSRSESRSDVKTTTTSPLVSNSRSLGNKGLKWSEPAPNICRKSSSSRWHFVLFGLVNVPPTEMDIRELKNRRFRLSKTPISSWESIDVVPVSRSFHQRKCSWRVLELLSCKSATSAVTTSFSNMAKV